MRRGFLTVLAVSACLLLGLCPAPRPFTAAHADTIGADPSKAAAASWFNWVDHASPGMVNDNIHIVNPNGAAASGVITVPGAWSANFSVGGLSATWVAVPSGVIGGPAAVQVTSGPGIIASQRIQYLASFAEIPAATALNQLRQGYFPWYDRASPGTANDNIHVLNPGPGPSAGTINLPGAAQLAFSVPQGEERYYNFPPGTINGPLRFDVTSGPGVVVSQRVQYTGSFNEALALDPLQAQPTLYFNWFDRASPGVATDNIHVVNPQDGPVTVTASGPGLPGQSISIGARQQAWLSWPGLGGPVRLDTGGPGVLATQRMMWPPTFAEWPGRAASEAQPDSWFPWYDDASPNFVDDVHITNPAASGSAAVILSLPGQADVPLSVAAGSDAYYHYPAGAIGGPLHVHVSSGPPVLAVQRAFLRPPPAPTARTLSVPLYHQDHPLSCEEASLRMALAYQGVNVSEDQIFAVMGIDWRAPVYDASGFHWGDPYALFVGDPNGSEVNNTGYGSYNEAVARTAAGLGGSVIASGEQITPDYLYRSILDGHPAVAWVPFDWNPHSPTFYTAFDGRLIRFGSPYEHAVTLIGVTPDSVLVNNPWQGQQWISKGRFEAAYGTFNNMAVILR